MQTFDRNTNKYLDHDHEEYALAKDVATISDIADLQESLNQLTSQLQSISKGSQASFDVLSRHSTAITSKLKEDIDAKTSDLLERIQNRTLNLSSGILDAGTFTDPQTDVIIDAGTFADESPQVLKEGKLRNEIETQVGGVKSLLEESVSKLTVKEDFEKKVAEMEDELASKIKNLSEQLKKYVKQSEIRDFVKKTHEHPEYALKSSLNGLAKAEDIPSDYVSAKELEDAIIAFRRAIIPVDEEKIVRNVLKRVKVPKNVEKVVEIRTEVRDTDDIEGRLKEVEDKIENTTEKAELNHRHRIADINGLAQALENGGGGGGQVNTVVAGDGVIVDSTDPANPVVSINREYIIAYSIML